MNEQVFIEHLKDALEMSTDSVVNLDDNFRDYDEWDSIARLSLIAVLDQEYDIEIESETFDGLKTVQQLFEWVKSNN